MKICRYIPLSFLILLFLLSLYLVNTHSANVPSEAEHSKTQVAIALPQPSSVLTEGSREPALEEMTSGAKSDIANGEMIEPVSYAGAPAATGKKTETENKEKSENQLLEKHKRLILDSLSLPENSDYSNYLQEVLAPALEETKGLEAPSYNVRALDDATIRELVSRKSGKIILKAKENYFLAENVWLTPRIRTVSDGDLDGYSHRALQLHSQLAESLKILLQKDYIYSGKDILVFLKLTETLDRLILAKQIAVARQTKKSFSQIQTTEGRLVSTGKGYSYLVENMVLKDKTQVRVQDMEVNFLKREE